VVLVLDARTGQIRRTLRAAGKGPILTLAFAPDGSLAAGSSEGTVELWNPTTGRRIAPPTLVGDAALTSLAFEPNGDRLATSDSADAAKLWFLPTLKQEGTELSGRPMTETAAAFVPSGDTLLVYDARGDGFSWPVSLAAWERRACAIAGRNLTRQEWARFIPRRAYVRVCP
jgi:WD40 repeat protein